MLRKCCYCIKLRKACIVIALIDLFINLLVLNLNEVFVSHIEQAVAICHCIGCFFLLGGALIRSTVLLMFFLITSMTNCLILSLYCIMQLVDNYKNKWIIVSGSAVYVCVDLYFWVVVYSYYDDVSSPEEVVEVV